LTWELSTALISHHPSARALFPATPARAFWQRALLTHKMFQASDDWLFITSWPDNGTSQYVLSCKRVSGGEHWASTWLASADNAHVYLLVSYSLRLKLLLIHSFCYAPTYIYLFLENREQQEHTGNQLLYAYANCRMIFQWSLHVS
jgi:hypothetical protein